MRDASSSVCSAPSPNGAFPSATKMNPSTSLPARMATPMRGLSPVQSGSRIASLEWSMLRSTPSSRRRRTSSSGGRRPRIDSRRVSSMGSSRLE